MKVTRAYRAHRESLVCAAEPELGGGSQIAANLVAGGDRCANRIRAGNRGSIAGACNSKAGKQRSCEGNKCLGDRAHNASPADAIGVGLTPCFEVNAISGPTSAGRGFNALSAIYSVHVQAV